MVVESGSWLEAFRKVEIQMRWMGEQVPAANVSGVP